MKRIKLNNLNNMGVMYKMERLLKNVTECDIINFDYIKRNDICLTDNDIKKMINYSHLEKVLKS